MLLWSRLLPLALHRCRRGQQVEVLVVLEGGLVRIALDVRVFGAQREPAAELVRHLEPQRPGVVAAIDALVFVLLEAQIDDGRYRQAPAVRPRSARDRGEDEASEARGLVGLARREDLQPRVGTRRPADEGLPARARKILLQR